MVGALAHRGPDAAGLFHDDHVVLGATRLAILDLSPAGRQPMRNPEGTVWIAYNGETYNFAAERARLEARGLTFDSHSDTEVVLRLYETEGDRFVERLRGMFALAVYDRRRGPGKERLLLARDHLGIKPLLYASVPGGLVFASEIKALLASGLVSAELDREGLRQYLTYGAPRQPRTILEGVRMLPAAHRLVWEDGAARVERYWSLQERRRPELWSLAAAEAVDEVERVLGESVGLHLVSDVPLGAFLSGGIDSTLLVALMQKHRGARVRTFSVAFGADDTARDESDIAQATARILGTEHATVHVAGEDVARDFPNVVAGLDQPTVDGVNSYFVSRAAAAGVTVAISGLGGDELFAGYPWYFDSIEAEVEYAARTPLRQVLRRGAATLARSTLLDTSVVRAPGGALWRLREMGTLAARFPLPQVVFAPPETAAILGAPPGPATHLADVYDHDFRDADELPQANLLNRISALCIRSYMTDQLLRDVDAASMASSLEVRVPFVDVGVADLALSLAPAAKLDPAGSADGNVRGKRVLRDLLHRLVPDRPRLGEKRGFNLPWNRWMRGPLAERVGDLSGLEEAGIDTRVAAGVATGFAERRRPWTQLWVLAVLAEWLRAVRRPSRRLPPPDWAQVDRQAYGRLSFSESRTVRR
jgi:asparagine synthase (glutamine-hydrolysing)